MSPLIKDGDTVSVRKQKNFVTGDVIAYFNEQHELIVHRYATLFGLELTKADRNRYFDSFIIEKPLGRVLVDESVVKKVFMFIRLKIELLNLLLRGKV